MINLRDTESQCRSEKDFYCSFSNRLLKPKAQATPDFLKATHSQSSYFSPLKKYDSLNFLNRDKNLPVMDQLKVIQTYSEQLPDWVYLYLGQDCAQRKRRAIGVPFHFVQRKNSIIR